MAKHKHKHKKKKHEKTPAPTPTPAPAASGPTLDPVAGTVSPAVAQAGDTGTSDTPGGGDLTGTSALAGAMQDSVFGQGAGYAPQYQGNPAAAQTEAQAQTTVAQPEGAA